MSARPSPLAVLFGAAALLCTAASAAPKAPTFPPGVEAKLAGLSAEQRAFIADPAELARFGLTPEKLAIEFERREAADVAVYVAALISAVEESRFHPDVDTAEIQLNPNAPAFNGAMTLLPPIFDTLQREPGPFSLDRYLNQKTGVPTFARAPIALRREDLVAGKVEVAFVGVPLDFSSGWRDAKHAPATLRAMDGLVGADAHSLVDPNLELRLADYGNIAIDPMSPERTMDHVRMMIRDMASAGVTPFIIGGDHSLMYPDVAAMADVYGKGKVGVVHLGAHYDAAADGDHLISDQQAVDRLLKEGLIEGRHLIQVGLRGQAMRAPDLARLRAQGVRYHTMAEIEEDGWDAVMKRTLKEVREGPENVFISFDISVLDPAYAMGAGRPVPNGLTTREAIPLVRRLCAETKVVGFEMTDVAPILDPTYKSPLTANYIMHACLSGVAMRKRDLKDAYVNPLNAPGRR